MRDRGATLTRPIPPARVIGSDLSAPYRIGTIGERVDGPVSTGREPIRFCGVEVVVAERMPRGVSSFVVRMPRTR
jgi:hypothetical protein